MSKYTVAATIDNGNSCSLNELCGLFTDKVLQDESICNNLKSLRSRYTNTRKQLVSYLITNLTRIISASPNELRNVINEIESSYQLPKNVISKQFMKDIYKAFSYDGFRKSIKATWLAQRLSVKTCMYCNAAFTLVVEKGNRASDRKALLEFDHFHPKEAYPYLSMSFFNLIPVCGNCNLLLSKMSKRVHPYVKSLDQLFTVSLERKSLLKCRLNPKELPVVDVTLNEKSYKTVFDRLAIKARYSHFADIGQEIIWRQSIYTKDYLNELRRQLKGILLTPDQADRFILGNYCDTVDYHKRPLTKFYADIGAQLGLIRKKSK